MPRVKMRGNACFPSRATSKALPVCLMKMPAAIVSMHSSRSRLVQGALTKVSELILRSHLRDHVVTAAQRGDVDQIVEELMEVLKYHR